MSVITSKTKSENYEVEIKSDSGHTLIADEPIELGGRNKGMSPDELIITALAACTSATLKMYAQRKDWDLQEVRTNIKFIKGDKPGDLPTLQRAIELQGNLDLKQRERLIVIAGKCPIHKLITGEVEIFSELI